MGRSREPPVFTRFGATSDEAKLVWVARHTPKRLPSRRWAPIRSSCAPNSRGQPARRSLPEFQTKGRSRDDEDEYDLAELRRPS
jgi:hypothetical protein